MSGLEIAGSGPWLGVCGLWLVAHLGACGGSTKTESDRGAGGSNTNTIDAGTGARSTTEPDAGTGAGGTTEPDSDTGAARNTTEPDGGAAQFAAGAGGALSTEGGSAGGSDPQQAIGTPGTDIVMPASLADFCGRFYDAVARYYMRCVGGAAEDWRAYGYSLTACGVVLSAEAAGHIVYRSDRATACLAAFDREACGYDFFASDGACRQAAAGQVQLGAPCRPLTIEYGFADECVDGTFCRVNNVICDGTCVAYGREDTTCTFHNECAAGYRCGGTCMPEVGEGEACLGYATGTCKLGFYCEGGTDKSQGLCRRQQTSGACTPGRQQCAFGYSCVGLWPGPDGAATGECARTKVNGPCTPGVGECYFFCGPDGNCSDGALEGQPCGVPADPNSVEFIQCARNLYCETDTPSGASGTCMPQRPLGQSCQPEFAAWRPECAGSDAAYGYCTSTHECALCE